MKKIISVFLFITLFLNSFYISGVAFSQKVDFSKNINQSIDTLSEEEMFASDSNIAAIYSYDQECLKQISSESTTYRFDYDNRNNITAAYIGDDLFADYSYTDSNLISSIVFGNMQSIHKNYDKYSRVASVSYGNELSYEYDYTNSGEVGVEKDYHSSRVTKTDDVFEIKDMESQKQLFLVEEQSVNNHIFTLDGNDKIFRTLTDRNSTTKVDFTTCNLHCYIESAYDDYGRVVEQCVTSPTVSITGYYEYCNDASDFVQAYKTVIKTNEGIQQHAWQYKYDESGNIVEKIYSDAIHEDKYYRYSYGENNELIHASNSLGTDFSVNYDNAGNILCTDTDKGTNAEIHKYAYSSEWGDQLISYDENNIEYDKIGNPTAYQGNTYTWVAGRQLSSIVNHDMAVFYTYDEVGHRTKKIVEKGNEKVVYEYFWLGDALIGMTVSQEQNAIVETVYFLYDMEGNVYGFIKNENELYLYEKSKTGDIIAIYGQTGVVASYQYDDYGNIIDAVEKDKTISAYNPFYYRSYCYDAETGMYYLLSRYYIPQWGRFLNADAYFSTGLCAYATNMFAYCANNSVNASDLYGYWDKDDHKNWSKSTAIQLDFWGSDSNAIGDGSRSVDIEMSTNPFRAPIKWSFNQRYHFDRRNYCDNISNGEDTRLYYYEIFYQDAISAKKRGDISTANDLFGKALHFIQDYSSHGDVGVNKSVASHGTGFDDPTYNWTNDNNRVSVYKLPSTYQLEGCPKGYGDRYNEALFVTAVALIAYSR